MKRLALRTALAALAITALAASSASARSSSGERTCTTTSKNVTTKNVTGTAIWSHISRPETPLTQCPVITSVMNKMLGGRIETPRLWESYRCRPTVTQTHPDVVDYKCIYRGAVNTNAFARLTFTARYDRG